MTLTLDFFMTVAGSSAKQNVSISDLKAKHCGLSPSLPRQRLLFLKCSLPIVCKIDIDTGLNPRENYSTPSQIFFR